MATKSKSNGADHDDDEKELEPVGPNVDADPESSDITSDEHTMEGSKDADDEDEEKGKSDDEEVGHLENKSDDEEDEQPKKLSRRERQRQAKERDKRELAYLRIRVDQLEQTSGAQEARVLQGEAAALDARITQLQNQLALADEVVAEATTQGVKKDLLEGQRIQREVKEKLDRLKAARSQLQEQVESATEAVQEQPANRIDPAIRAYAQSWLSENEWYDPKATNDKETQRVKRIDAQILREGFDPREEDYWDELTRRVKKALPHRFDGSEDPDDEDEDEDDDEDNRPARRQVKVNGKTPKEGKRKSGGPTFTTRGREVTLKPNQVAISPARKAAMIEAGVWDDPAERQRYLKSFQRYDREHGNRA